MAFRGQPVVGAPAFATPTSSVDIGDVAVQGAGPAAASSQHQHAMPAPPGGYVTDVGSLLIDGSLTAAARADHAHRIQSLLLAPGGAVDLSGTYARRGATTDAVQYVAVGGSDANDGLSLGAAKATIQAAHDALPASGGTVLVGPGVFALPVVANTVGSGSTNRGVAINKSNVTVRGAGKYRTTLTGPVIPGGAGLTYWAAFVNVAHAATGDSDIVIEDLTIDCGAPIAGATGMTSYNMAGEFWGVSHSAVRRCRIIHGGVSFAPTTAAINTAGALTGGTNTDNLVDSNRFVAMTGTTQFFQGTDSWFCFNRVEQAWDDAFSAASAGTGHRVFANFIDNSPEVAGKGAASGCIYLNNDGAVAATVDTMAEILIFANKLQGANGLNSGVRSGVAFAGAARDIKILDNWIGPNNNHGIYCLDGTRARILIRGNTIAHNVGNGINCQANVAGTGVDVSIISNDIYSNGPGGGGGVGIGLSASGAGAALNVRIYDNTISDDGAGTQTISLNALTNVVARVRGNRLLNTTKINGTFAVGSVIESNEGVNPRGAQAAPAVPASTVALTNPFGTAAMVWITGGTVSGVSIGGTATGAATPGWFRVPANQTITLTYTVAPVWAWFLD